MAEINKDSDKEKSTIDLLMDKFSKIEEHLVNRFNIVEKRMDNLEKSQSDGKIGLGSRLDSDSDRESQSGREDSDGSEQGKCTRTRNNDRRARGTDCTQNTDRRARGTDGRSARGRNDRNVTDEDRNDDVFSVRDGNEDELDRGEFDDHDESVSDFQIEVAQPKASSSALALSALEDDLEIVVEDGDKVDEKIAKVIKNRFTVKCSKEKLESKTKEHKIPENCQVIKAPLLDDVLTDKGLVDRNARKDDNRLADIQSLIATATAALVGQTNSLNNQVQESKDPKEIEMANKVIKTNGDIFAVLGLAQQELSQRRRFEIGKALPREIASISTATIQTGSGPGPENLFGHDVERLMRNARDSFRAGTNRGGKSYMHNRRGQRYHPYGQGSSSRGGQRYQSQQRAPFLGKSQSFSGRGTYSRGGNAPRRGHYRK